MQGYYSNIYLGIKIFIRCDICHSNNAHHHSRGYDRNIRRQPHICNDASESMDDLILTNQVLNQYHDHAQRMFGLADSYQ